MKQISKISGIAYLMIFVAGFYANFNVLENLVVNNNPITTVSNIITNQSQFGYGLLGFLVMLFFDVVLVWSLFGLTKSINKNVSYIASFFRLLHALFFSIATFKLWKIYQLTSNTTDSKDLQIIIMELLSGFDTLWTVGLLFFGVHLIVLGYLSIKSIKIPKAIGVLLIFAAIGYIIDGVAKLCMLSYSDYKDVLEVIVIIPAVVGEFSFTFWLLIKGFKKQSSQQKKIKSE